MTLTLIDALAAMDRLEDDLPPDEVFRVMSPTIYKRAVEAGTLEAGATRDEAGFRIRIDLGFDYPCPLVAEWIASLEPSETPQPQSQ